MGAKRRAQLSTAPPLALLSARSLAKLHATLIALVYFLFSFVVGTLLQLPVLFVVALTVAYCLYGLLSQLADAIMTLERFDRVEQATQLGRQ